MCAELSETRPGQACLEQGKFSLNKETEDVDPFPVTIGISGGSSHTSSASSCIITVGGLSEDA
jgi:hypothetical protein